MIYGQIKKDIGQILRKLCEQKDIEIIEAEACPDHIHMLISFSPKYAIEACCDLPAEQRIIHLQLRKQYRSLFYRLENPYSDTVRSIRIGEYRGYGLKNINRIVQENHGDFYTKKKDGVFTVQVRLNCEN